MQTKTSSRNAYLLRRFGITQEQYDDLYRAQDGRCAVCNRHASELRIRLSVDHDHSTREIRGLLCTYCNRYIVGRHRREGGIKLLSNAAKYLEAVYTGWLVPEKKRKKKRKKRRGRILKP